jgi:lipoate-protein ligase A
VVRLLPYAVADGPANMAADETLLESAVAGTASLRFYGWSEASLSLGYFQPERLRHADARLAGLPFVRRPTGGDALVHHHELTYALALPAGRGWQSPDPCLRCVHRILATALAALGVRVRLHVPDNDPPFADVLCFLHHTAGDLILGTAKVAGSAQRKQRGAILQHGAVLLAQSPHTPALPGIRELTGRDLDLAALLATVQAEFVGATGWELDAADWTAAERRRIDELVAGKYNRDAWNRKR